MNQTNYCAFISYRHLDPDMTIAKKLHSSIETYHIPISIQKRIGKKRLGKVFRDAEELPLSSNLGADIEKALDKSEWFIAICSPEYLKSKWCIRELEYFVERHGLDHVLTVLVDGEPEESFPEQLLYSDNCEGERVEIEPLAADVRESTLSKSILKLNQEKLRLLAPMLSVGFDDLKRRARLRRIRILSSIIIGILAITLSITGIIVSSNLRAERLQQEAEEQRIQANKERRVAADNSISEHIEKAINYYSDNMQRKAVALLLEAVKISDENDSIRHEEIISLLRRVMYTPPLTPIDTLSDENLQLTDIIVSPNEKYAIGVENGKTVVAIDLESNETMYRISNKSEISYLEFSSDSERFLTSYGDGRYVQVWNVKDGSSVFIYQSKKNTSLQISNAHFWNNSDSLILQDWDTIYIVSSDGNCAKFYTIGEQQEDYILNDNIYTLDGFSVEEHFRIKKTDYMGTELVLSNDKTKVLVTGKMGETGTIILDENGNRISLLERIPATYCEKYAISPDGKTVSCISTFGFFAVWDVESGKLIGLDDAIPERDDSFIQISNLVYSPNGDYLSYVFQNMLVIRDGHTGVLLIGRSFRNETVGYPCVAFSKDSKYLCLTCEDAWFITTDGQGIAVLTGTHSEGYTNCVFLQNTVLITKNGIGTNVYSHPNFSSVSLENSIETELCEIYDASKTNINWEVKPKGEHQIDETTSAFRISQGMDNNPILFYSVDGETAALAYPDGFIELFKREDEGNVYSTIRPFDAWLSSISSLAIYGDYLFASGGSCQLIKYNIKQNNYEFSNQEKIYYYKFAFDPNGKYLMAMGLEGYGISVFDFEHGDKLFDMYFNKCFNDIAFSMDGAYAVGILEKGYAIADMLLDEAELLSRAQYLIVEHE